MTVAVGGQNKDLDGYLQQFASMRAQRVDFDVKWQMVSDYILPRRDFSITQRPNTLRPHRVTSSVATNANTRMMAFLLTYAFDPTRPFLTPNVKRGLAAAGRNTQLDDAGSDYLNGLQWQVFDHLMLPKAQLMLRFASMLKEFCAFGCGVLWTGRRRGFGPYFNARPIQACWWSENDEGEIDTLYFKMMLPVYRVLQRWPLAATLDGWKEGQDKLSEANLTSIILACRPRQGGRKGAVAENKPFEYVAISEEKKAILEVSGYDSFPYQVFRYDPMPGNAYAEGPGCQVLPDVMVLNHLQEAIEDCASQKARPPLAIPARMFGKTLDRRPGAVNAYNSTGLGLQRADQAIIKMDFTGDPTECRQMAQELTGNIEIGYFTDWLRLRDSGDVREEEIFERRDQRLRGAASIVANFELPLTALGDRSMEIMIEEGQIPPGPASVAGANVDWEYSGPLQIAQLAGNVRSLLQLVNARGLVAGQDPAAAEAVDLEEALRAIAEGLAAPPAAMTGRAVVAQRRAAAAHAQQQQQNAEKLAQVAGAARDGGQAMTAVAGALGGGGSPSPGSPPAQGAPFAPAAPFAPPIAA